MASSFSACVAADNAQISGGEVHDLMLKADASSLTYFNQGNPEGRRVYVFAVDPSGQRNPLCVRVRRRRRAH
jgi:hypothetical protein